MADPHPFRRAIETSDGALMSEALREDIVFHSPVLFRPFKGRDAALAVLSHVNSVLNDFEYTHEAAHDGAVALRFKARVGERELEGIDFLELDEQGRVSTLTVFMRPMSALQEFSAEMAARLNYGAGGQE